MAHENLHLKVEIEIEGFKKLSLVSSLVLSQRTDWHHTFEVKTPLDAIEGERSITISKAQDFVGKEIKIALQSQSGSRQLNFFKGIITNVSLSRHGGSASDIVITGHSSSILLDDGPDCSTYLDKSLKQIIQAVTSSYPVNLIGVTYNHPADPMAPFVVQYNESSYNFISRLANTYGQWFYYNGTEMIFGGSEQGSPTDLYFGHDLSSFDLTMKVTPLNFDSASYDYVQHKELKAASSQSVEGQNKWGDKAISNSKSLFNKKAIIHNHELVADQKEIGTIVSNITGGRGGGLVILTGESDNPGLKVGGRIKIQGSSSASLGSDKTDYGIFIITEIVHRTGGLGSYTNRFTAIPADIKIPPANPHVVQPKIDTQMAKVIDNKDPEGIGRIKVRMFWQEDNDSTGWIRYASTHAGKDRGFYMLPEIDDEVIIAFENGNPNMPFALGSMYHGTSHSGDRREDSNLIKTIRTKSGNEIKFMDKGGEEAIHIFTKDGANSVLITAKDDGLIEIISNKNIRVVAAKDMLFEADNISMKAGKNIEFMASSEMMIKSGKDMTVDTSANYILKVDKDLTENVGKNLDVSVGMDSKLTAKKQVTIKGNILEVSATMKGAVKAGASLEVSSTGNTTLKGAMVMIN